MTVRSLLRRYPRTLTWVLATAVLYGYPALVMRLNPPPELRSTETVVGRILQARRDQPHVRLQLADGRAEAFDFPSEILGMLDRRGLRFDGATDYELGELAGCQAELQVDRVRFLLLPSNPRIWELRCPRVTIPYSRLVGYYENQASFRADHWLLVATAALLLLACISGDVWPSRARAPAPGK